MVPAVRPLRSLSIARGCARIDSRLDTVKIGSADRVEVHRARLLAIIGVRKTFPHGLRHERTSAVVPKSIPESLTLRTLYPAFSHERQEDIGPFG
jgi:hypothetical protein